MDPLGANAANTSWLEGQRQQFYVEALARYAILRWENLADEKGDLLAVTSASLEAFAAHPDLSMSFVSLYLSSLREVAEEGNVSTPSSAGASPAGPKLAEDAATEETSADDVPSK
jgi:hypothetical protein